MPQEPVWEYEKQKTNRTARLSTQLELGLQLALQIQNVFNQEKTNIQINSILALNRRKIVADSILIGRAISDTVCLR